jgi:hypothetical protein
MASAGRSTAAGADIWREFTGGKAEGRMQNAKCRMQNAECRMINDKC